MAFRKTTAAMLVAAGSGAASIAQGAVIMSLQQVAGDVVATVSGTVDTQGLVDAGTFFDAGLVWPSEGGLLFAPVAGGDTFKGFQRISGPRSFGGVVSATPSSFSGSIVGVAGGLGWLALPDGYVSGSSLAATMTFTATTLGDLEAIAGSYTWTWGAGAHADSLTLTIGAAPDVVPQPSTLLLLGTGIAIATNLRRRA